MKALSALVALLAATLAGPVFAAVDGTPGATSTGTFSVSATVSQPALSNVFVGNLQDFSFAGAEGETINSQEKVICILRENGPGEVGLTISGFDAADTYFRVKTADGTEEIQMLFTVRVPDELGGLVTTPMTEGTEELVFAPGGTSGDCALNQSLIAISLLNTATAAQGVYFNSFLVTLAAK